jgi:hypothetical protein
MYFYETVSVLNRFYGPKSIYSIFLTFGNQIPYMKVFYKLDIKNLHIALIVTLKILFSFDLFMVYIPVGKQQLRTIK